MQPGERVDNQYRLELIVEDAAARQEDPLSPMTLTSFHSFPTACMTFDSVRATPTSLIRPAGNTVSWQLHGGRCPYDDNFRT